MKIKVSKKTFLVTEWIILFLLGLSHYIDQPIISIMLTFCLGVMMYSVKIDIMIVLLFTALPFFNLFNGHIGNVSLYYIFICIFIWKYFFYKNKKINKNKFVFFIWLFALRITGWDLKLLITWSLVILVLILTYKEDILVNQLKVVIRGMSVSMILSSIFGYIYLLAGKSIYNVGQVYMNGMLTTRFAGLIGDSVFFAQFCAVLVAANLVICYFSKKNNKESIIYCILLTGFDLLTYSKTGILLIVFVYVSYIIATIYKNAKSKITAHKTLIIALLFIIMIYYLINYVMNNTDNVVVQNYILRFSSKDLMTGRNIVSEHYIMLLLSSWTSIFFAMPQSIYSQFFPISAYTQINTAHNIYLETICAFGFTSAIILFCIVLSILIKNLINKRNIVSYMPIGVLLISGYVLHGHFESHYYILFAIALAFINITSEKLLLDKNMDELLDL